MNRRYSGTKRGVRRNVLHVEVQKRGQSKKFYLRSAVGLGAILLMAALGLGVSYVYNRVLEDAFYTNRDFQVRTIDIRVQGAVTRAEVLQASGVQCGQNLMALNLDEVRARLKRMSYVEGVRIERQLPSTLKITIEERQPVARIAPYSKDGNQLAQAVYYVDPEGYIMKPRAGERLKLLPVIMGVEAGQIQEGQKTDRMEIGSALNLLRLADYSALKSDLDLTQIIVDSKDYLILRTQGGGRIRFRTSYLDQQIMRLASILDYAHGHGLVVRTVDLTPERNVPVTFLN